MLSRLLGFDDATELAFRAPLSWAAMALAFLAVIGVAIVLYRGEQMLSRRLRSLLAVLRALTWVVLITLLLEPVLGTARQILVPSNVLVLVDVSESMATSDPRRTEKDILDASMALGMAPIPPAESRGTAARPAPGDAAGAEEEAEAVGSDRESAASARRIELARGIVNHSQLGIFRAEDPRQRIRFFRFGDTLEPLSGEGETAQELLANVSANAEETRLGTALRDATDRYSGQTIDGVVVLTDGASNAGLDPIQVATDLGRHSIPVYAVGLGLTRPDDVRLKAAIVQGTVFEADTVPVRVEVASSGYEGRNVEVTVSLDGAEVARAEVELSGESRFVDLAFVPSGKSGDRKLRVAVAGLAEETNLENNSVERTVRVIDEKIKVLYVEGRPRWEYRYLRAVLLRDPRLDMRFLLTGGDQDLPRVSTRYLSRFPDSASEFSRFDLVILGDVPPYFFTAAQLAWMERLVREDGGSFLLLAGEEHAPLGYRGTPVEAMLPVDLAEGPWMDVPSSVHPRVAVRDLSRAEMVHLGASEGQTAALWSLVRPLYRLAPIEGPKPGTSVLLTLSPDAPRLGGTLSLRSEASTYPLVAWHRYGTGKSLYVGSDQLWRLRYRQGDRYHARFWAQAIRFLTLSRLLGENQRVRIETDRQDYRTGERIAVYATVLNESHDPVGGGSYTVRATAPRLTDPVEIVLRSVPGRPGLFQGYFTPEEEGRWEIRAPAGDEDISTPRAIDVAGFRREKLEPDMRRDILERVSELSGGRYLEISELGKLAELLPAKTRHMEVRQETELWDHWTLFVVLITCLAIEWFVRRRYDLA